MKRTKLQYVISYFSEHFFFMEKVKSKAKNNDIKMTLHTHTGSEPLILHSIISRENRENNDSAASDRPYLSLLCRDVQPYTL